MSRYLYLFQIGPVQSFIAAARRTQDLYVGSRLLSLLASAGVSAAQSARGDLLFPVELSNGNLPDRVPHRFAFLNEHVPDHVVPIVKDAIDGEWRGIAAKVRAWLTDDMRLGTNWHADFDRQVANWLEIYWVAVPYDRNDHARSYRRADIALAQRKQLRHFPAVSERGEKCTLTGAQTALPLDWAALRQRLGDEEHQKFIRANERLGALATIKRFAQQGRYGAGAIDGDFEAPREFPSTNEIAGKPDGSAQDDRAYFLTVLHMDGDFMGKRLSLVENAQDHRRLSAALADFAEVRVPKIIAGHDPKRSATYRDHPGRAVLVYSGGDDVLALMHPGLVLSCANQLQAAFREALAGFETEKLPVTMSAGIAIAPFKLPLDGALQEARDAEEAAKNGHHRDAVVVREAHRSAQVRQAGAKWTVIPTADALRGHFANGRLSGKLGFDLYDLAAVMDDNPHDPCAPDAEARFAVQPIVPEEARAAEALRLLRRRLAEGLDTAISEQIVAELGKQFADLGLDKDCGWMSLANWTILARFLAHQETKREVM